MIPFFLLFFGCGEDGSNGGQTPTYHDPALDFDGDGYSSNDGDCNDLDRDISPEAPEYCDQVDNDCDAIIDESGSWDASYWYSDSDSDGFGVSDIFTVSCERPSRFVSTPGDCDDNNPENRPGALEQCDEVDNDCDELVDEGEPDDVDTFYADQDGDGAPNPEDTIEACSAPKGYVSNRTPEDCDDLNDESYPGAPEVCDGQDNDCDDLIDEPGSALYPSWYLDSDLDGYGDTDTEQILCEGPIGFVKSGGDCDESNSDINPGEDELCDGIDNNCDGLIDDDSAIDTDYFFIDADGDDHGSTDKVVIACEAPENYTSFNTDCDDNNDQINPDSPEICDKLDNDCDGEVDEEGSQTFYPDLDGDGYGAQDLGETTCTAPLEYVTEGGDCDDEDPFINPNALEFCGKSDEDCDGQVDESGAEDAQPYYQDNDGDNHGAERAAPIYACSSPENYSANNFDCNDTDPLIHENYPEVCNDGRDNDCDESPGECTLLERGQLSLENADVTLKGTQAGALFGEEVSWIGDVNHDGYQDFAVGAWKYSDDLIGPGCGAIYIYFGPLLPRLDNSRTLKDTDADLILTGETADDRAGSSIAAAGDVNNDGYDDFLVGASRAGNTQPYQGAAYLFYGPVEGGTASLSEADSILLGENISDGAGTYVEHAGDVNSDGFDDIIIGATGYDYDGLESVGAAYLFYGPVELGSHSLGTASARWTGEIAEGNAGFSLAGGEDLNGDDIDDIVIGSPHDNRSGTITGSVHIIYGRLEPLSSGPLDDISSAILLGPTDSEATFGYSVDMVGDLDGDGFSDIVVGAPYTSGEAGDQQGLSAVIYGPIYGIRSIQSPPDTLLWGFDSEDEMGIAVASAGDLNQDGFAELLLGAWSSHLGGASSGYVALVSSPGDLEVLSAETTSFTGIHEEDRAGISVDGDRDLNGDGLADLLIGALASDAGAEDAGSVYILLGRWY